MKRMIPPIFMLLLVVVITLATPIDAQVKVDERQPVEPMTTTTVLSTESLPEMSLEAEPETVEVDDGLLTSPQSQHISPSIISVRTANIITAKPLRVFVSGITEALNGQK